MRFQIKMKIRFDFVRYYYFFFSKTSYFSIINRAYIFGLQYFTHLLSSQRDRTTLVFFSSAYFHRASIIFRTIFDGIRTVQSKFGTIGIYPLPFHGRRSRIVSSVTHFIARKTRGRTAFYIFSVLFLRNVKRIMSA